MAAHRQDRLNRQIAAEVGEILRTVKDPRVSGALICVTGAEVSPDLSNAKIFYGFLGSSGTTQEIAKGLASASGLYPFGARRPAEHADNSEADIHP